MKKYQFKVEDHLDRLIPLIQELESIKDIEKDDIAKVAKRFADQNGQVFKFSQILNGYKKLAGTNGLAEVKDQIIQALKKKPTRTASGVTPVTVLTKPFPCPGKCIFCPNDVRMPKSYLSDEPGAQRAERNFFDPYLQTYNRLEALSSIGHNTDKVEIIILGGTWSFYPEAYQIWFIKECFRALNDFGVRDDRVDVEKRYQQMEDQLTKLRQLKLSNNPQENKKVVEEFNLAFHGEKLKNSYNHVISNLYVGPEKVGGFDKYQVADWTELEEQQKINETAISRCVGLVVETRPDNISEEEVLRIRRLGATKTQIGVQSLQDEVLELNKRGHDVAATRKAFKLLRQAGFKIHAHWMANLYGSDVEKDMHDFDQLFSDPDFHPDELKIYPCSLISSAELMQVYKQGKWRPYDESQLLEVVSYALTHTPGYCRLTRVIRDIPSDDIVAGNKKTNFRQISEKKIKDEEKILVDIRSREIRDDQFEIDKVRLERIEYQTSITREIFLQFVVETEKRPDIILAFLRLSLPDQNSFIDELAGSAMIREIHVYGPAVGIGKKDKSRAQHEGFGTQLIKKAREIAKQEKYDKLSVISSIGTREYYRKKGFSDGDLYQHMKLN